MFTHKSAFGGYSTNDIDVAKKFYSEVLGLKVSEAMGGAVKVEFNNATPIYIYPKPNHEPATFTVLNLVVDDINSAVQDLKTNGVKFEMYEGMGQDENGVSGSKDGNGPKGIAWFKDPAGNILSILQE